MGRIGRYALLLSKLYDFLDAPRPDPTRSDEQHNIYVFEKAVEFHNLMAHFAGSHRPLTSGRTLSLNPSVGRLSGDGFVPLGDDGIGYHGGR
jgi:hypothetical protein